MKKTVLLLLTISNFGCKTVHIANKSSNFVAVVNKSTNFSAYVKKMDEPTCSIIPSLDDIKTGQWRYIDNLYSAYDAAKIGIPIVNASGLRDLKVFVRDYSRASSCTAQDGKTVITYGQVIRSVIEIENYDASAGVSLASIAASGTIKRNRQQFYFYKDGFYNPKIDEIISTVSGKVFDVENYALFQGVMTQTIALLASPETQFSVNKIGLNIPSDTDEYLYQAPITSYALTQIAKGVGCQDILNKYATDDRARSAIQKTFNLLKINCNDNMSADVQIKLKAGEYLQGLKVK